MKQNEEINKDGGYICLFRKFMTWEWYDDANTMRVFLHCLLSANHKENKWHGITVKQGSFITSIPKLAYSLKLSSQQIRTALNKLKSTGEITHETTSQYSIISIKNWVEYQKNNSQNNRRITDEQQTDNRQITINNNDNNEDKENNENNINELFNKWYSKYPKKISKQKALQSFEKVIKNVDFNTLMIGLDNYIRHIEAKKIEDKYIKHPATWLNQGCWDDEYKNQSETSSVNYDKTKILEIVEQTMERRKNEHNRADV